MVYTTDNEDRSRDTMIDNTSLPPYTSALARRWWLTLLGVAMAAASTALFSSDWCFVVVGMGILGGVISKLEQWLMATTWGSRYRGRPRLRAITLAVVCFLLGMCFMMDQSSVFSMAFGAPPSSELRELTVSRHYAGGPGEDVILIHFFAPTAEVEKLLAAGSFVIDTKLMAMYPAEVTWPQFWERYVNENISPFVSSRWEAPAEMLSPALYRSEVDSRTTRVLWDQVNGEVYAISYRG